MFSVVGHPGGGHVYCGCIVSCVSKMCDMLRAVSVMAAARGHVLLLKRLGSCCPAAMMM